MPPVITTLAPGNLDRSALILDDFAKSRKARETDGSTVVSVYRSGVPAPPADRDVEKPYYLKCDEQMPDARQGRMTAVFCSPTLGGVSRWVLGNYWTGSQDINVREIRIDIDRTYVYSVPSWETACELDSPEGYQRYWDTGMTVRAYMAAAQEDPIKYDPRDYELLVAEENILSVSRVAAGVVAHNAYDDQYELKQICDY